MKNALAVLSLALVGAVASVPAFAGSVYSNGPLNGQNLGYTINSGYSVSDSFTLSSTTTVTSVDFGEWFFPGDSSVSVDWSIGTTPFSGSTSTAATTGVFDFNNQYGFDVYTESFSTGDVILGPGTYYLTLSDAATAEGNPAYWDMNNGPSIAYESAIGNLNGVNGAGTNSETFDINGTSGPVVPEPSSLLLMGSGLVSFAGMMRRKLKA